MQTLGHQSPMPAAAPTAETLVLSVSFPPPLVSVYLYVVKEFLGHSSIQITEKYAHLSQLNWHMQPRHREMRYFDYMIDGEVRVL